MCFKFFSKKKDQPVPYISQNPDYNPFDDKSDFVSYRENTENVAYNNYNENADNVVHSETVNQYNISNGETSFTLTEFGGEIEGGFRETENPTKEELERAIKNIVFYDGEFFTLGSSEPINGYTMLSGSVLYGDDLITASAHVESTTPKGKVVKAYDQSSVSSAGLLEMLTNFMKGRTPDVNDGNWKFDEVVYTDL